MDLDDAQTQSFVVRIWIEETRPSGQAVWRGHITHVPSGERQYFQQLADITTFIVPYLASMGVPVGVAGRTRSWLTRWTRSARRGH